VTDYTTPAKVKAAVGLGLGDVADDTRLADSVAAANAWATRLPHAPTDPGDPAEADFVLGVTTLAGRLYKRRTSPEGYEATGDGLAVYVPKRDADIDRLMRLNRPRVG
jgi:nitrogen fixation protein